MRHIRCSIAILCFATATAAALAPPAAAEVRTEVILPTENCQPALPAFDGNIRKRPLAMQNEGATTAFVTCSFVGVPNATRSHTEVSVQLINTGSAPRQVACTLVDGQNGFTNPAYVPKTTAVAGGATAFLQWTSNTYETNFVYPALSCALEPDTGIQYTYRRYDDEIVLSIP